jgi:hypothetical protein
MEKYCFSVEMQESIKSASTICAPQPFVLQCPFAEAGPFAIRHRAIL